jgi:hypothetical protein
LQNEDGHGHGYPTDRERRALQNNRQPYVSEPDHLIDLEIEAQVLKREEKRGIWFNKAGNPEASSAIFDADIAGLELHLKRSGENHNAQRSPEVCFSSPLLPISFTYIAFRTASSPPSPSRARA